MEYNIYMTNDCNLMCEYCSVLLDCKKNHIPLKPVYKLEDLVEFMRITQEKYNDKEMRVFFFGGEPTLEMEEMLRYGKYMREKLSDYDLKLILHTNGLLVSKLPKELLDILSLVMYSLNYEKIPHYNLKDSYFSTVYDHAIDMKKKRDIPIIGRLTITEKTSLYTEIMQAVPFFDMIYWQIENTDQFVNYEQFYKTYIYEVQLLFKVWIRRLRRGEMLFFIPFMAVIKFMFYHDRADDRFICGYDKHMLYVQTNGECYACCDSVKSGQHHIGDIYDGIEFRGYRLDKFMCRDCKWRSICMGRCGRLHVEYEEKNPEHIKKYCKMNEFMFQLFEKNQEELEKILISYPYYKDMLKGWQLDIMEYIP